MITFRLADESDYQNINNFFNRIYGTNRSLEAFYWEFHHCPHGSAIYVVAEDDGKVIGTNCVIPIDLITADQHIIRSGKSEDTLVDPAYRGQKIFYRIYEFLFEKCREANIQVIWGFTSAKKPFRKAGFSVPYDHKQSIAVHRPFRAYRYLASLNKKNRLIDKVKILGLCILSKSNWLVKSG
ncbi:MAG: GNAT family N-acetyltransferase [Bacteroidota bacterium]